VAAAFRRRVVAAVVVLGGLAAILAGMAYIDPRVRQQIDYFASGRGPTPELRAVTQQAMGLAWTVWEAVRDQSIEHAPLTIFGLAAAVLVLFMLRIRI
jgi:hypothetical protein